MRYFEIVYHRSYCWTDKKYIKDDYIQGAINKARVKNIIDVIDITEEQYNEYTAKQKSLKLARKIEKQSRFIQ